MDNSKSGSAMPHRIGIDVGGTKIEGIVLDAQGCEVARKRCTTPVADGYAAVVQRIADLYDELLINIDVQAHTLGIGTPGSISPTTGLLRNCNATTLNGQRLYHDLEQRIGRSFAMANDANCFALAEARSGAASRCQDVLGLVLGTGVGAGLVIGGQLVSGHNGIGGEWGHMVLDRQGPRCYCGRRGCTERYLSGPALEQQYADDTGTTLSSPQIIERARAGDKPASAVLDRFLHNFAQAVANAVALVDPQVIVIGGGLASINELYTVGVERLHKLVFSDHFATPVVRNELGNTAGVFGAAMMGT